MFRPLRLQIEAYEAKVCSRTLYDVRESRVFLYRRACEAGTALQVQGLERVTKQCDFVVILVNIT